jgi:hypothetical protein
MNAGQENAYRDQYSKPYTKHPDLQLDDMRMSQDLQVLNFSFHSSVHFRLIHLSKVDNLHCNFVPSQRVCRNWVKRTS